MNVTLLVILIVLNIPLYLFLGRAFFGDLEGFVEAVLALFTPDVVSAFRGRSDEHTWGRFALIWYVAICVLTVAAEYHIVAKFLLGIENPWGWGAG
jgi:hypothetical protein